MRLRSSDEDSYEEVLREEYAIHLTFDPKVILDAGANIGMSSIYFANKYPNSNIIAIEPEASNFEVLSRNVRPYASIIPIHAALWNRDGEINVFQRHPVGGAYANWGFATRENGPGAKVRAITVSTLMREMNISTIDLAKIDIEGAEREAFEDARWLAGVQCLMIELHDRFRPGCAEVVDLALAEFDRANRGLTTFYFRRT